MSLTNEGTPQPRIVRGMGNRTYQRQYGKPGLGYQPTLMYGRYTKDLGEYARAEARRYKVLEERRRREDEERNKHQPPIEDGIGIEGQWTDDGHLMVYDSELEHDENEKRSLQELLGKKPSKTVKILAAIWRQTFARLGEDWVFLALLGIITSLLSYLVDIGIAMLTNARLWLYRDLTTNIALQYLAWISLPVALILFAAGFVHVVSPQSIGSGIPEMKVILRGVVLKEYLTFKTLVAKFFGIIAVLGAGMPLGKESPFVHIASIIAQLLSKLVTSFQGIYENESRNSEMLSAACAVGVSACFASPIGGVLYSIEATSAYFAVRNYWRGFFSAVFSAIVLVMMDVWLLKKDTLKALFETNFSMENPFDPQELFIFGVMGVFMGLAGAFYVWLHRKYVIFMRSNKMLNNFFKKNRFLYPGIAALIIASITFPIGTGQFIAGELSTHEHVHQLFSNFSWSQPNLTMAEAEIVKNWSTPWTSVLVNLALYSSYIFLFSIVGSTIPVPSGMFIPSFKIGAGFGRLIGELTYRMFPNGVWYGNYLSPVIPGGYAVVGGAAFTGAVTHTISVAVMTLEMSGQITHTVPIMISVLIANGVASMLQPSLYDSIIMIKKLPYLPDLLPSGSGMYNVNVEDFMVSDVKYVWRGISYQKLKEILKENKQLRSLPLVDSPNNMIILGSVQRYELLKLIEKHIGRERRLEVAAQWRKEAEERALAERRRSSRFEIIPAPDVEKLRKIANNETETKDGKKSILKKADSLKRSKPSVSISSLNTSQSTIPAAPELPIRTVFGNIFRKSTSLKDVQPDPERRDNLTHDSNSNLDKKVQLPRERICDMSPEEQEAWEFEEMEKPVEMEGNINIDPAPFQLVERTSLVKVHSLFSMLSINHAYVTKIGRLVGVVALKELRQAIEDVNSGKLKAKENIFDDFSPAAAPLLEQNGTHSPTTVNNTDAELNGISTQH